MLIRPQDKEQIISLAKQSFTQTLKLWAYGSRVSGEAHDTSDLDMVLITNDGSKVNREDFVKFRDALQDSTIPILTQVLDWNRIPKSFHKNILENYEEIIYVG